MGMLQINNSHPVVKNKNWLSAVVSEIRKPSCLDNFSIHTDMEEKPDLRRDSWERQVVNSQFNAIEKTGK